MDRLKPALFAGFIFLVVPSTFAQEVPAQLFTQMGSVAAVAEKCYSSTEISTLFHSKVKAALQDKNINLLKINSYIDAFDSAYLMSQKDMKIWSLDEHKFSLKFSCDRRVDVETIRCLESRLLAKLKY